MLLVSATMFAALGQAQPAAAIATGNELKITGPHARQVKLETGYRPYSWSSSGRFLALIKPAGNNSFDVQLLDLAEATSTPKPIGQRCGAPQWSPDGQWIALATPEGLKLIEPASNTTKKLGVSAQCVAWSPDSRRLALSQPQKAGSEISILAVTGQKATPIWSGARVRNIAWSPDGFTLAAIINPPKGPELATMNVDGRTAKSFGAVDDGIIAWSPGSKFILTQRNGGYAVLEISERTFAPVPGRPNSPPTWIASQRLLATIDGIAVELNVAQQPLKWAESPTWGPLTSLDVNCLVVPPVIALDGSSKSEGRSLAKAPKPLRGQIRLQGRVSDIDPYEDAFSVDVTTAITSDGREFEFPNPLSQVFSVGLNSTIKTDDSEGRLRSFDLKREGLIAIIVDGLAINSHETRTALSVFVPQWEGAVLAKTAKIARTKRVLIEGGVSLDEVVVPMIHPLVGGAVTHSNDFQTARKGHRHQGNDLMAPKLRPVIACFDGRVTFLLRTKGTSGNYIRLTSDDGWTALYMHINNDTPNTNDGLGGARYAFAPGLKDGDRVVAGQLLGWCGNSGNAETTSPHVHFELHDEIGGGKLNPYFSVKAAKILREPVLPQPLPSVDLRTGESQVRGIVVQADRTRNVLVVDVMASRNRGEAGKAEKDPRRLYAVLEAPREGSTQQLAAPATPNEGSIVTLVGSARDANSMTVRSVVLEGKR